MQALYIHWRVTLSLVPGLLFQADALAELIEVVSLSSSPPSSESFHHRYESRDGLRVGSEGWASGAEEPL